MGQAVGSVLPMAIGVAIGPVPVIAVILMLFSARARQNGLAFLAGWVIALTVVGAVVLVLAQAGKVGLEHRSVRPRGAGAAAVRRALPATRREAVARRSAEGKTVAMPKCMSAINSLTAGRSFGIAVLLAGVNPKNLALTIAAALAIAASGATGVDALAGLLVFVVVASLSVAVPVLNYLAAGDRARKLP